jgi:hypothetical protein
MNHKRKRSKRQVKCTMCTQFSWMGNTKERHSIKYQKAKKFALQDIRAALVSK